ncbi:hypothetical protein CAEBREN_22783 [Caenorhabditis brenneri]|uniref:Peptidase S1 domain-containing protein n=1 Tax=Caenorhabditis brenneri TaxID=135651 RepID=G0P0A4_CAEBE|nr:hypothetical protein CAEBREN_22783 [Caenorhabditis brenneri]
MCHIDNYRNDDLAILELYEDVQYSNFVRPICTVRNTDFEQLNKFVQVTGFGLSYRNPDEKKNVTEFPVLRHGWLQIFDKSYSKNFFGAHNLVQQTGGDSGGPGYIENGDRNYLIGITSIGSYLDMYFASVGIHANQICQQTGIC